MTSGNTTITQDALVIEAPRGLLRQRLPLAVEPVCTTMPASVVCVREVRRASRQRCLEPGRWEHELLGQSGKIRIQWRHDPPWHATRATKQSEGATSKVHICTLCVLAAPASVGATRAASLATTSGATGPFQSNVAQMAVSAGHGVPAGK